MAGRGQPMPLTRQPTNSRQRDYKHFVVGFSPRGRGTIQFFLQMTIATPPRIAIEANANLKVTGSPRKAMPPQRQSPGRRVVQSRHSPPSTRVRRCTRWHSQLPPPEPAPRRTYTISKSINAPEIRRIVVKLAASMLVCRSAMRQSNELLANATMASDVRTIVRGYDIKGFPSDAESVRAAGQTEVYTSGIAVSRRSGELEIQKIW